MRVEPQDGQAELSFVVRRQRGPCGSRGREGDDLQAAWSKGAAWGASRGSDGAPQALTPAEEPDGASCGNGGGVTAPRSPQI